MIDQDFFKQKLKKAGLLIGYQVEVQIADALYEELKNEDKRDFLQALRDLSYSGERLNLANILKHLLKYKADRIEKEHEAEKRKQKAEVHQMLKNEGIPDDVKSFLRKFKTL